MRRKPQKPIPEDLGWSIWLNDASVPAWTRIERLVRFYGFPSVSALAREIDPEPWRNEASALLRKVKSTDQFDERTIELILRRFPELNPAWVIAGLPTMFRPKPEEK